MLQLLFTVAFSALPLSLYVPPIRNLSLFVEAMEDLLRGTSLYTSRVYPRLRFAWSRFSDCLLCNPRCPKSAEFIVSQHCREFITCTDPV